jgi:hypothetical protein
MLGIYLNITLPSNWWAFVVFIPLKLPVPFTSDSAYAGKMSRQLENRFLSFLKSRELLSAPRRSLSDICQNLRRQRQFFSISDLLPVTLATGWKLKESFRYIANESDVLSVTCSIHPKSQTETGLIWPKTCSKPFKQQHPPDSLCLKKSVYYL